MTETTEVRHRQARRGRPGKDTDYRRIETTRYSVTATIRHDVAHSDAASDGCWPLVTNDRDLRAAELFDSYRWQPNLECRHRLLKCKRRRSKHQGRDWTSNHNRGARSTFWGPCAQPKRPFT